MRILRLMSSVKSAAAKAAGKGRYQRPSGHKAREKARPRCDGRRRERRKKAERRKLGGRLEERSHKGVGAIPSARAAS